MTEGAAKDDLVNLPQKQGSRKSQRAEALRDFWEEEERSAHASIVPFGAMRERSRLLRRGKVACGRGKSRARMTDEGKRSPPPLRELTFFAETCTLYTAAENAARKGKMTKLVFVRHGESESNVSGYFTGQTDVPLSPLGRRQAQELKEYLLKTYTIGAVYSSDLQRARDTVMPAAQALGLPVRLSRALREVDGGEWEEKPVEEVARDYAQDYAAWCGNIGLARCTGGESMAEVQRRGIAEAVRIAAENEGKTVLIGTHAGFLRAMQCHWQHLPLSAMKDIPWVPNASATEVDYEGSGFALVRLAECSFLHGDVTRLTKWK